MFRLSSFCTAFLFACLLTSCFSMSSWASFSLIETLSVLKLFSMLATLSLFSLCSTMLYSFFTSGPDLKSLTISESFFPASFLFSSTTSSFTSFTMSFIFT
uniref:Secreted protein n=1 Tax=Cacopsylla melanoneura TaxID=428564 RepID=A0A8D9EJJ1_9HEMI